MTLLEAKQVLLDRTQVAQCSHCGHHTVLSMEFLVRLAKLKGGFIGCSRCRELVIVYRNVTITYR